MFKKLFFLMLLFTPICFAQTTTFQGIVNIPAPSSANTPSLIATNAGFSFSNSGTISAGTVNTGDIIDYFVTTVSASQTFTMTDNCNTGGASDTNVTDSGPTNQGFILATSQSGHFVVGLGRSGCTVTDVATGSADIIISIAVIRGSSGLDQVSAIKNQNSAGTGANAVLSNSVTTTHADLCIGASVDTNDGGGTLTAGTTIAWTIGTISTTFPNSTEYFAQSSAATITATFGFSVSPYTQTHIACYKP